MNNTTALSVHHLKKTFRTSSKRNEVLKDVNIVLEKGVVAILGSNGAGKTTFIRSCTDLLDYEEGIQERPPDNEQGRKEQDLCAAV